MTTGIPPAKQLLGRTLPGGWRVLSPLSGSTGGTFSEGYIVEKDGRRAFLKALDYSRAFGAPDVARALEAMTSAYNFERDVLKKCRDNRLSKIVTAIDSGKVDIPGADFGGTVEYLIFELADGDIRTHMAAATGFDFAWALRTLHQIAIGLKQLHGIDIAHQDLKPSNVLVFENASRRLADMGRAEYKGHSPPHEDYVIPGDPAYAPPELLYDFVHPDWNLRRLGCDVYLLGSMMFFLLAGASANGLLMAHIPDEYRPRTWAGTFPDVLPVLRTGFAESLLYLRSHVPLEFGDDIVEIAGQLCDPDPALRGHPRNRASRGNPLGLERFVTRFDVLAGRAEYAMRRPK